MDWQIDGALGDALDQGQFRINATSADGRSLIRFGHSWVSHMEFQHGPYQPGAATIEWFVLPPFLQQQGYVESRVTYHSANRRVSTPSEIDAPI